jgi:hypothetical protein
MNCHEKINFIFTIHDKPRLAVIWVGLALGLMIGLRAEEEEEEDNAIGADRAAMTLLVDRVA